MLDYILSRNRGEHRGRIHHHVTATGALAADVVQVAVAVRESYGPAIAW
jgi:hypothetical protein